MEDVKEEGRANGPSQDDPPPRTLGKQDGRLDNTLKPDKNLSRTMSLEEATTWIVLFESYLNWNKQLLGRKSITAVRHLLESSLEAGLVSKLRTDVSIGTETEVQGPDGVLAKLKGYFIADYPMVNRRHDFTKCTQDRGEKFKEWWETKLNKARKCDLEAMKNDDWLVLELLRWVSDTNLQKQLLRETDLSLSPAANLSRLVLIAEQWQAAESTQEAFGNESAEYARQALADHERDRAENSARKTSDYKAQIKNNWNKDHGSRQNDYNNNCQSNADECHGCGARGDRMHLRDVCPAQGKTCFNCDTPGHFLRVCRKPPRQRNSVSKMVRVGEIIRGGG
jgi:hypothetical protein